MQIIKKFDSFRLNKKTALSLGMFDGVHLGHQSILKVLMETAKEKDLSPSILSFWPHPRLVFDPECNLELLNTIEEKANLMQEAGIEYFFLKEFDEEFRQLSGEDFVKKFLVDKLNVGYLMVGYDHTFGKDKSGNYDLLKSMSTEYDFEVVEKEAVNLDNYTISSTKIRKALEEGNITHANEMLGYHYTITGNVIHGKKIGRTIGYPTANISIPPNKILPKNGAYITEVFINNQSYKGMTSIGTNPTVNGEYLQLETYILNFDKDIYDKEITINFRERLHDEIKFDGLDKLIERLDEDKRLTETFKI